MSNQGHTNRNGQQHTESIHAHWLIGHQVNDHQIDSRENNLERNVGERFSEVVGFEAVPVIQMFPEKYLPF